MVLPLYMQAQTAAAIEQRAVAYVLANYPRADVAVGSHLRMMIAAAAVEQARGADRLDEAVRRSYPMDETSIGVPSLYLDARAAEVGDVRIAAVKAHGTARFTGTAGTTILAGTRVATGATESTPARFFTTDIDATIAALTTTIDVPVTAETAGAAGNIAAQALLNLVASVAGVSAVTNLAPFSGGSDTESDPAFRVRYNNRRKNPPGSGKRSDYVQWALDSSTQVGGASVVPLRDGPQTVSVAIINAARAPADQALVDLVQDYIAPPHRLVRQAEAMTRAGSGTSIDATQADDVDTSVKMVFVSGTNGTIRLAVFQSALPLPQPGVWQIRTRIKVGSIIPTTNLITLGVWNNALGNWARTTPTAAPGTAVRTLRAADLSAAFEDVKSAVNFYADLTDGLELRIDRLNPASGGDATTSVWVDQVTFRSTFSQDTGPDQGHAPIGARVTVEAAAPITANVSATLVYTAGYDPVQVRADAATKIIAYINSLAFANLNDVQISGIQATLLATAGVTDYSNVLINTVAANLVITAQQVAIAGTISLT